MGKIIVLDENTANKIAAGEVIERPASVVKELVENSIDAGATKIQVEIRNGGISLIKVIDNGSGLAEDDVELAFERHATSKIRRADDLESISSMGFRGEALASIAAVSSVELITRVKSAVQGVHIEVKGGFVQGVKAAGCPIGTTITVRELFFNTPARYKFLKKDSTEAGHTADVLSRIALGYPDISFQLVSNGTVLLHTPGNGDLKSTIFSVYGAETAKQLLEVSYDDGKVKVSGFIGKAELSRSNRNHQSVYINRRYIKSKTITAALDGAYSTFLMKNRYAFALLDVRLNQALVDVNVHPSKMEVKFSSEQDIYRAVFHAVNSTLLNQSSIRNLPASNQAVKTAFTFRERAAEKPVYTQQSFEWVRKGLDQKRADAIAGVEAALEDHSEDGDRRDVNHRAGEYKLGEQKSVDSNTAANTTADTVNGILDHIAEKHVPYIAKPNETNRPNPVIISPDKADQSHPEDMRPGFTANTQDSTDTARVLSDDKCDKSSDTAFDDELDFSRSKAGRVKLPNLFEGARIVGQAFSTYILLEREDELFLLDQHAAHERIRYEELKKAFEKSEPISQMLMEVLPVELTGSEYQFALSEKSFFERLGYTYESFGTNSIILRTVPFEEKGLDIKEMFVEILDCVMNDSTGQISLVADETLYAMACKSAVKAHKKLDDREIEALLDKLASLDNPYTCPHGRPAILRLRRYELEKLFKRIV